VPRGVQQRPGDRPRDDVRQPGRREQHARERGVAPGGRDEQRQGGRHALVRRARGRRGRDVPPHVAMALT
jgi:hypothetical protein